MSRIYNGANYDAKSDTLVYALGGLGEVGKNMYCIEHDDEILIIDAGIKFPDEELLGVEYVIPDYTHLIKNRDKIVGLIITHGHEDHIGGIPFLLMTCPVQKIYAPRFAKALIEKKLSERRRLANTKIIEIDENSSINSKYFRVGFFNTVHSIPDSLGVLINTPNGRIVETGDFKFDLTPVGENADYQKMAYIGAAGVTLLMSDSTNSEVPGFSISEKQVASSIMEIMKKTPKRLIVSTFASNVHRLSQIIKAAKECGRKVCVFGRSMENVVEIGLRMKTIDVPEDTFISPDLVNQTEADKLCIVCTGSQGEQLAALSRIANNTHKFVHIIPGDTVLLSSNPIPGNALNVSGIVNKLVRNGAKVIQNQTFQSLHTTGHASCEEQKLMLQLIKPKYFMPVHGEYKMLKLHAATAVEVGLPKENIFVCANGDALVLHQGEVYPSNIRIQTDAIYVDGNDISGLSTSVLKDRKILADNGLVAVVVCIDSRTNKILCKPGIVSRGFIYIKENQTITKEAEALVYNALQNAMKSKVTFNDLKNCIRNTLEPFLFKKSNRNPLVIPVILNHKDAMKKREA
ncbi:MAG: ribonuclease J [Erysipelotrichaceae bacterium]